MCSTISKPRSIRDAASGGARIQPGHTSIEVDTTPFHLQDFTHPAAGRQGKWHHRYEVPGQFLQQSIRFLSLEKANATLGFFEHANLRDTRDPFPLVARQKENAPDDLKCAVDVGVLDPVDLLSILDERPQDIHVRTEEKMYGDLRWQESAAGHV